VTPRAEIYEGGGRITRISLLCAAGGVILMVVGALFSPARLFYGYLAAFAYIASIALGALIFLMIGHAMRAGWPVAVRRVTESIVGVIPLLLLLFVPIALGAKVLYPWLRPETIEDEHVRALVAYKAPYLSLPFFLVRTGIYFAIWLLFGELLRRWSLRSDTDRGFDATGKSYALSGAGLPAVALSLSFASFDWIMSLEPAWFSTMYPVYYFAGGFLGALATITALSFGALRAGLLPQLGASHFYALGRLLLAFTIFWAYAAFFQLLLIWIANKPEEVSFYVERTHGAWAGVSVLLALSKFVVPFFVLLNYRLKRNPKRLSVMAGWLLVAHYIDVHWLVVPARYSTSFPYHIVDLGALLAVGGAAVAFGAYRAKGRRVLPVNDPSIEKALAYESV